MGGRGAASNAYKTFKGLVFKQKLKNGEIPLIIDNKNQTKHIYSSVWKNQVKISIENMKNGGKGTPRSILAKNLDVQKMINQYSGKGFLKFRKGQKYPEEFVKVAFIIGRTYDKKKKKYVASHTLQIKYGMDGVHIFPTKDW